MSRAVCFVSVALSGVMAALSAPIEVTEDFPATFDASTGYVTALTGDSINASYTTFMFTTNDVNDELASAGKWNEAAFRPHAGANYYSNKTMSTPNPSPALAEDTFITFAGDSLVMGPSGKFWFLSGTSTRAYPRVENLYMLGGSEFYWSSQRNPLSGTAHIRRSSASKPVKIDMNKTLTQAIDLDFEGSSSQWIAVFPATGSSAFKPIFDMRGSWANYLGCVHVYNSLASGADGATVRFEKDIVPSAFYVKTNCLVQVRGTAVFSPRRLESWTARAYEIESNKTWTVGDLVLHEPTTFVLTNVTSRLVVTNSFVNDSGSPLVLRLSRGGFVPRALTWQALSAPSGVFTAADFSVENPDGLDYAFFDDGTTAGLRVQVPASPIRAVAHGGSGTASAFLNGACWQDGLVPHSGNDYVIDREGGFYLPGTSAFYEFPGMSLTLSNNAAILVDTAASRGLSAAAFYVKNASFTVWSHDFELSGGPVEMLGPLSVIMYGGSVYTFSLDSELTGTGDLKFSSYPSWQAAASSGTLALTAANTNYQGRVTVTMASAVKDYGPIPSDDRCATLRIADARSLGGPLASFEPAALQLEQMSILHPETDLTLGTQNRGLRISGCGRVDVPANVTLTLANPVTYAGVFRKEGEGALALAARPRFLTGDISALPLAGTNILFVQNGWLMPQTTNCLDGVRVRVAQTGGLRFPINPQAEGMREFGVINLSEPDGVPFELIPDAFTERLTVSFETASSPAAPPTEARTMALMTVSQATAAAIAPTIRLAKAYPDYESVLCARTNADDSVTLYAAFRAIAVHTVTPASAATPIYTSESVFAVPSAGHLVFSGWMPEALSNACVVVAEAPSYRLPSDWSNWSYEPAVDGHALCFAEEGGRLVARLRPDVKAYARQGGKLVLSNLGTANALAFVVGSKTSDGSIVPSGINDYAFSNVTGIAGCIMEGSLAVRQRDEAAVRAVWSYSPSVSLTKEQLTNVGAQLTLPAAYGFAGAMTNGQEMAIAVGEHFLTRGVSNLTVRSLSGAGDFTLTLSSPMQVYFSRESTTFMIRLYDLAPEGGFSAGETYSFHVDVTAPARVRAEMPTVVYAAGEDWIPTTAATLIRPGSALDFTDVCGTGRPAGKYGRVVRVDDHFEFANRPGVRIRFLGMNMAQGPAALPAAEDPRYADQMRRGYNATCCGGASAIIDLTDEFALRIDPEKAQRYDAYIAHLIENGFYFAVYLYDNSRNPTWRAIGEDRDGKPTYDEVKSLLLTHEGMVSNYLAAIGVYLTHTNAFTGRCLLDEPALIGVNLAGEHYNGILRVQDMGTTAGLDLAQAWAQRVREKKLSDPDNWGDVLETTSANNLISTKTGRLYGQFLREKVVAFEARARRYIREELHSDILISNMQETHPICFADAAESRDYIDTHFYEDHPTWHDQQWSPPSSMTHQNANPIRYGDLGVPRLAKSVHWGYPFIATEFNYCAPGRYRMSGGLLMGATAALQDWSGVWQYARSNALVPLPMGFFSVMDDPLMVAYARAVLTLFARGDLPALTNEYVTRLDPEGLRSAEASEKSTYNFERSPAGRMAWYAKVGLAVTNELPAGVVTSGDWPTTFAKTETQMLSDLGLARGADGSLPIAGGGHVTIDDARGAMAVFTDRTCGGFAEGGAITAGVFRADIGNVPAAIWISSLDGRPLASSRRMLLSHLTNVQDTGSRFLDDTYTTLLNFGRLPHLMQRGRATVNLAIGRSAYRVFALAADGARRFEVPVTLTPEGLSLTCDTACDPTEAVYLYELVRPRGCGLVYK